MTPIPDGREPFVVMAKPVGSHCNLNCRYCYYLGTDQLIGNGAAPRMDDATLEAFISRYIADAAGPVVQFTWHGGEPTLAGLDFYRRAVELQKQYLPAGWECWNNLQTNGILLDDAWCDFLAQNHFDVGLSIDGAAWVHDTYRLDHTGAGTYSRVAETARRLVERGVKPDLLCTVTSDSASDPLGVYESLRDLGTGWMQFIPIVRRNDDGSLTPDSVTPEGYGEFLRDIFARWLYHDLGKTGVQLFAETALVLSGGSPTLCWMAPTCGRVLVVERDGGVYACDHFVSPEHKLGTVQADGLRSLADSETQRTFGQAKRDSLTAQCKACPYLPMCGGGCLKDRFARSDNGEPGQYYLCDGLRSYFSYAVPRLTEMLALQRTAHTPVDLMAALREKEEERWKGVGRNDLCPCGSGKKAKKCCWDRKP